MSNQAQVAMQNELLELNALLEEGKPEEEGFDDLDSLLNESVGLVKAAKEVKAAKLTLKRSSSIMDPTERQFIEAKVAAWEAAHTWKTLELVAVFRRQACACGSVHETFSHFMHHQQHRTDAFAQRWVSATFGPDSDEQSLPRNVAFTDSIIPMCRFCASDSGFDLQSLTSKAWEAQACGELHHAD